MLRAFSQLLDALATMDAEGLWHGNLKPENILFDRFGNAKLGDFGFARLSPQPPQAAGIHVDLQALGTLLYEALTGRQHGPMAPFPSKVVAGLPTAIDWIIEKLTVGEPSERYADPSQARTAMLAALADPSYGGRGVVPVMTTLTCG